MSLGGLDSALSGLRAAQQQMSVLSNNIANASTPGYTRKILPQETVSINGQDLGVATGIETRNADYDLSKDFWTQTSAVGSLNTTSAYLTKIQQYHGDPTAETSVASAMSALDNAFTSLSDNPGDSSLQTAAVNAAQTVANKVSGFGALITQMRNDAQSDMSSSVSSINSLLTQIASLNQQVSQSGYLGQSTASAEDQRDTAIQTLSQQIQVTTFKRSDGVLVVQTKDGELLADTSAQKLSFSPTNLAAQQAYPTSAAGIYIGDPNKPNSSAINITAKDLGGNLGALTTLRDKTLPQEQSEVDELAEQTATRFDQQGLRLFSDKNGNIPSDAAPTGTTPVAYVGFASAFQVNPAVLANNTLVQTGTAKTDVPVQSGSNAVVRRIVNNAFGSVDYQQAAGTVDVRSSASGGTSLQNWLGVYSSNQVTTQNDLANYNDASALISGGGTAFGNGSATSFSVTFADSRIGAGPTTINVNLAQAQTDYPISGTITNAAQQIAAEINHQVTVAGVPASMAANATVNTYGQLSINSRGNITVDASGAGQMGTAGLSFIGLTAGTQATTDPSFTVQVGDDAAQTITVAPGDTETSLVAKLQYNPVTGTGVPGLDVNINSTTGALTLRPGGDDSNGGPTYGGDLTLTGDTSMATGTGTGGTPAGAGILQALFGKSAPVADVDYSATSPLRTTNLGTGGNITSLVTGATNIVDYAQKMVDSQTGQSTTVNAQVSDETNYLSLVQKQVNDQSGVNIDQELSNMITVQAAYAASARVITAINDSFTTLLNAFGAS